MTYDKSRGFQLEGPGCYLIYLRLYLSREIIEILLSLIVRNRHLDSLFSLAVGSAFYGDEGKVNGLFAELSNFSRS